MVACESAAGSGLCRYGKSARQLLRGLGTPPRRRLAPVSSPWAAGLPDTPRICLVWTRRRSNGAPTGHSRLNPWAGPIQGADGTRRRRRTNRVSRSVTRPTDDRRLDEAMRAVTCREAGADGSGVRETRAGPAWDVRSSGPDPGRTEGDRGRDSSRQGGRWGLGGPGRVGNGDGSGLGGNVPPPASAQNSVRGRRSPKSPRQ